MNGVVLLEANGTVDLAHHDDDGGGTAKDCIASTLVGLPGADEVGDALMEELAVDLDSFRHGENEMFNARIAKLEKSVSME